MTTPPRPRKRRWPKPLVIVGLLLAVVGAFFFVVQANNHAVCIGTAGALVGNVCERDNIEYEAGRAVFDIGLVMFLAGVIGSATDHARQRWRG